MTVMTHTPAATALLTGDINHLLEITAASLDSRQFVRELVKNGETACELIGGGMVRVDYDLRTVNGVEVPKLRFLDNGIGMDPEQLIHRVATFGAADLTGKNFGVGAKVSLRFVSPAGVEYITMKDGVASRMTIWHDGNTFGPRLVNDAAEDIVSRHVEILDADSEDIPEMIRAAGHGTSVVLIGKTADDPTAQSLTPDTTMGHRWALMVLQDKFAKFAEGVTVQVSSYGYRAQDTRPLPGTSVYLDANTAASNRVDSLEDLDANGAKGTISLPGPVAAQVNWWVLPKGLRSKGSHYKVGGKFEVIVDNEVLASSSKCLRRAGVYASSERVHMQIVPTTEATIAQDAGRNIARIDGRLANDLADEWAAELSKKLPAAIKLLLTSRKSSNRNLMAKVLEMYTTFAYQAISVRKSSGPKTGKGTGNLGLVKSPAATNRGNVVKLRTKVTRKPAEPGAEKNKPGQPNSAEHNRPGNKNGAKTMVNLDIKAPEVVWVNDTDDNMNDQLKASGNMGYYDPVSHSLVLNWQFTALQELLKQWVERTKHWEAMENVVAEYIRDAFEADLVACVLGSAMLRCATHEDLGKFITEESLTFAAFNVRGVNHHVGRAVGTITGSKASEMPQAA